MSSNPKIRSKTNFSKSKSVTCIYSIIWFLAVGLIKNIFNLIDKEDKGEISNQKLTDFIRENSIKVDLHNIKKLIEENGNNLKL